MKFGPMFLAALAVAAQTAPPTIRVNVNLIQVDVTVTRDGKRVTDLTAADFEIYQNGKKQPIRSVLWVPGQRVDQPAPAGVAPDQAAKSPDKFRLEDIRRTIVIVVDDSSLTPFSMFVTQQAVRKIIEETMGGQDLVAVYRTSNPRTLMQQFTTNKTQVLAAIDWMSKSAPAAPEPLRPPDSSVLQFTSRPAMAARQMETQFQQEVYERVTKDFKTASMLGIVNLAVAGMRDLPGRKSMVLISEGVQLMDAPVAFANLQLEALGQTPGGIGGRRNQTAEAAQRLVDSANRAGVMIYTVDPRGLTTPGFSASMDFRSHEPRSLNGYIAQQQLAFDLSHGGLAMLAAETGGVFYEHTNDLLGVMRKALNDQEGYYLIGFQPDDKMFEDAKGQPKLQKLSLKVTRPGTSTRYRRSFFGIDEEKEKRGSPLAKALVSPLPSTSLPVKITPVFLRPSGAEPIFRTLVHIDVSTLKFNETPAGPEDKDQSPWREAFVREALVVFDETAKQVDYITSKQSIKIRQNAMETALREGIEQEIDIPVPKPGQYQVRVAVIDESGELAGSAARFVEAPDLTRKHITLSGIMLASVAFAQKKDPDGSHSRRIVKRGEELEYAMTIYNSTPPPVGETNLSTQVRLFHEGKTIFTGDPKPLSQESRKADGSVLFQGRMRVTAAAGQYVLELAAQDSLAPAKRQVAARYIDFTVRD